MTIPTRPSRTVTIGGATMIVLGGFMALLGVVALVYATNIFVGMLLTSLLLSGVMIGVGGVIILALAKAGRS